MISVTEALDRIVVPAVADVFQDSEVTAVSVTFDPAAHSGSISVLLTAEGEGFHDLVVQGDVPGCTVADWRERLRSNLADWVAESRFGWGQDRGV